MKRLLYIVMLLPFLSALSCGGLYPEQVDAELNIADDGSYTLAMKGTFLDYGAMSDLAKHGAIREGTEVKLAKLPDELMADDRYHRIEYLGDGRFAVELEEESWIKTGDEVLKESSIVNTMFSMELLEGNKLAFKGGRVPDPDKTEEAFQKALKEELAKREIPEEEMAEALEFVRVMKIQDMLMSRNVHWRISVTTDAEVLEHNAQVTPWFFGLFGAYEWDVRTPDNPAPYMLIQLDADRL